MHFHLLQRAPTLYYPASIVPEIVVPHVLVWILSGTKVWRRPRRQLRIGRIPPRFLDLAACGCCFRCRRVFVLLLQMEEKVAS